MAYIRRGLSAEGNLRFKINWASLIVGSKFTVFALFYFVFGGQFSTYNPPGGLYLEGRFDGGFFALPVWGGLYLAGLYMEGLIFGLLRYTLYTDLAEMHRGMRYGEGDNCIRWHEAYFNFNSNFYTDKYRTMKIGLNK